MHIPLAAEQSTLTVLAGALFDPLSLELPTNQVITVSEDSGLILDVQPLTEDLLSSLDLQGPRTIDLRNLTVLPGFVDVHVHFFLHPYSEVSWEDQLTKESLAERAVRATVHAHKTLMAGFTTVRDLGTEGAGDADIALRKCLSGPDPIIPGPRYFCATRAIVPTGAYGPKSSVYPNQEGIDGLTGAEVADGQIECIKAVRRQIGAGADWIKIYADYRFRSRIGDVAPAVARSSMPTFSADEVQSMITTSHQYGVKVAAHASESATIDALIDAGVDSIEHGYKAQFLDPSPDFAGVANRLARAPGVTWVPTLAAYYTSRLADGGATWAAAQSAFQAALAAGVDRIACGGDTGVFAHGQNALELQLMVRLGAPWRRVLRWATLGGWECVRSLRWEGAAGRERLQQAERALIAIDGDLEADFESAVEARRVRFVMKGGKVCKSEGLPAVKLKE